MPFTSTSMTTPSPVTVGTHFMTSVSGYISAVRFWKDARNVGRHEVFLFHKQTQAVLARALVDENASTSSGSAWMTQPLPFPVMIDSASSYIVAYSSPGWFSLDKQYSFPITSGPLTADMGLISFGPPGTFPVDQCMSSVDQPCNYWVDALFTTMPYMSMPPSVVTSEPVNGATDVSPCSPLFVSFTKPPTPASLGADGAIALVDEGAVPPARLDVAFTLSDGGRSLTIAPASPLLPNRRYSLTLQRLQDAMSNTMTMPFAVAFVTSARSAPPAVVSTSPALNNMDAEVSTAVTVTFDVQVDGSSVDAQSFTLTDQATGRLVPSSVMYIPAARTAVLEPLNLLKPSMSYTVAVSSRDGCGNMTPTYSYAFTTKSANPPALNMGYGGPVMVVSSASAPFSVFYAELLRAEGFNLFSVVDVSDVTPERLSSYSLVIVGASVALAPAQADAVSDWVKNQQGSLVLVRPSSGRLLQLCGLGQLPVSEPVREVDEGYLLVDTATAPGRGIYGSTMQFHGQADLRQVMEADVVQVATLYTDPVTPTAGFRPAVSVRPLGAGRVTCFTYDLARSVALTRQGNPAWAGAHHAADSPPAASPPHRPHNLFAAQPGDGRGDWVHPDRRAVPQADEQQRLLANLMVHSADLAGALLLPRLWYFPNGLKAVVVMTEDLGPDSPLPNLARYANASAAGCVASSWGCARSTLYVGANNPLTDEQAAQYERAGFEIGLQVDSGCTDHTKAELMQYHTSQLGAFNMRYPSLLRQDSHRLRCAAWSGYTEEAEVESSIGIGLDTNYMFWPQSWVNDEPGLFTGSAIPMRFATESGDVIDIFQAPTQLTDVSGQSYPFTVDNLISGAVGSSGYYGAFVANVRGNCVSSCSSAVVRDAILSVAQSYSVPVVSARDLLRWLRGREQSHFVSVAYDRSQRALSFRLVRASRALGLRAMLPMTSLSAGKSIGRLQRDSLAVTFTVEVVKGVPYAMFEAVPGNYTAFYEASIGGDDADEFTTGKSGSSSTSAAGIAGAVVGSVAGAAAIAVGVLVMKRRRKQIVTQQGTVSSPRGLSLSGISPDRSTPLLDAPQLEASVNEPVLEEPASLDDTFPDDGQVLVHNHH